MNEYRYIYPTTSSKPAIVALLSVYDNINATLLIYLWGDNSEILIIINYL